MSLREELIEAGARAIYARVWPNEDECCPQGVIEEATAALDAILDRLGKYASGAAPRESWAAVYRVVNVLRGEQ